MSASWGDEGATPGRTLYDLRLDDDEYRLLKERFALDDANLENPEWRPGLRLEGRGPLDGLLDWSSRFREIRLPELGAPCTLSLWRGKGVAIKCED